MSSRDATGARHEPRRRVSLDWARRWLANRYRLGVALLVSIGCHLAGAWLVRIEPPLVSAAPRLATHVQYLPSSELVAPSPSSDPWLTLADPTLLALPHPSGFSRRWLERRPRAVRRSIEWPPPRLELDWPVPARREAPGNGAPDGVRAANEAWVPGLLEPLLQRPAGTGDSTPVSAVEWIVAPRDGMVTGIARPPFLPARERLEAASTRYRVGATAIGQVRYVLVDRSCGDPHLDRWGADELRRCSMGSVSSSASSSTAAEVEWGTAVVHWPATIGARP